MTFFSNLRDSWNGVMSVERNPIRHLPLPTAHLVMQILAWMWSILFSLAVGSYIAFGITAVAHALVLAGVFLTIAVFNAARAHAVEA